MRIATCFVCILALPALADDAWTHAGKDAQRRSIAAGSSLPDLSSPAWVYDGGGGFQAVSQATPVVSQDGVVVVLGMLEGVAHAVALEAATGAERWRTPIDPPAFASWSSPVVLGTREGGLAIVASGSTLAAFDLGSGEEAWSLELGQRVVNASPAIDAAAGLVLVTTYDPFGGAARLLAVDLGSGELVTEPTIGPASGASPALLGSRALGPRALVALTNGFVRCYEGESLLWEIDAPGATGFFGGLSLLDGHAYAATYGFSGGRDNSVLVKIDALDGSVVWSTPTERTNAMPIVLGDGRVVLSAGLEGFGSLPTVQVFGDLGDAAERRWDLAFATWDDLNGNGRIDPGEYLALGGWDHQPAAIVSSTGAALLVGSPTGGLALLDLDADPAGAQLVLARSDWGGGSPAVARGVAVSAWGDHVAGFALAEACLADFDGDGELTIFDFLAFQNAFAAGDLRADLDGDGSLTLFDFLAFQNAFAAGCG
ncbi:MAG: PQQ-binding-like beta-propeller repeat protein [Phycisphaeraceae bacterium]|nr:PQQ-binding-like beta-propeller repeat protein [Phycisphaeraceae bacterium]